MPTPLRLPPGAVCRSCGYSLHELTRPECQECGRAFDPDDRSTFARLIACRSTPAQTLVNIGGATMALILIVLLILILWSAWGG